MILLLLGFLVLRETKPDGAGSNEKADQEHVIILPPLTIHSAEHCQLSTESEIGLARTCCIFLQMKKAFKMLMLHRILWYAGFWHLIRTVNTV